MILPLQITFRNMQPSEAVAGRIRSEAAKLDRYYERITSCRVVVEAPHRHHKWGELFLIRIGVGVPGEEIVVRHAPNQRGAMTGPDARKWVKCLEADTRHKDIYVTIHDAFKAARRRLEDYARRLRGDVKSHERIPPLRAAKMSSS